MSCLQRGTLRYAIQSYERSCLTGEPACSQLINPNGSARGSGASRVQAAFTIAFQ
ncbi:hypothetical protein [Dictyobacter kobayashii]|uniref:hypothetical protein n=1 Tax=Dictyobacter kobayashii TaxID=2014872 RepID=UPI001386B55A|nr:hypothetical protein [Dictyobacter kobayashii]